MNTAPQFLCPSFRSGAADFERRLYALEERVSLRTTCGCAVATHEGYCIVRLERSVGRVRVTWECGAA